MLSAQTISELTSDIEERRGDAGDAAKYELLFKRDTEMTEFIDRFEELRDKEASAGRRQRARWHATPLEAAAAVRLVDAPRGLDAHACVVGTCRSPSSAGRRT